MPHVGQAGEHSHFTDRETEAQRCCRPCPKSHSGEQENWPWNSQPGFLGQVSFPLSLLSLPWERRELAGRGCKGVPRACGRRRAGEVPSSAPSGPDPGSRSSGYCCQDRSERATASTSLCQVSSSPFPSWAPPLPPEAVSLGRECFHVGGYTPSSPCEQELSLTLMCTLFHHRLSIQ